MLQAGTRRSARGAFATNLSAGTIGQSLLGSLETRGFSQDRGSFDRGHLLYRAAADLGGGQLHVDLDATILRQTPYSPQPREGAGLTPRLPLDSNINPSDARSDQDRLQGLASAVATYAPAIGPQASATLRYVGSRFLNKSNTATARAYAATDARAGWKFAGGWGAFIEAENLTNRRDAVTESELGDAQFYRIPGRRVLGTVLRVLNCRDRRMNVCFEGKANTLRPSARAELRG